MQPIHGLSLVVAMASNRVIGRGNELPWKVPSDLRRFKRLTTGHPVIMGRNTWESIPKRFRPLRDRTSIILTQRRCYRADGGVVVNSIAPALDAGRRSTGADEIFVIGGEDVYRQFLPVAEKVYMTIVYASIDGDRRFPPLVGWQCSECYGIKRWDPRDEHETSFEVYTRFRLT